MGMPASFADLDALENEMFDRYNGEGHKRQDEAEADFYDELRIQLSD